MNYFAHGWPFIDEPYILAGTAVPDWLSVVDRRLRVRKKRALEFLGHASGPIAALARGIVQHHDDDAWFHRSDAFADLAWRTTQLCRHALPHDSGFRPSFLGHILVELVLDAELAGRAPNALEDYYRAVASVDPLVVQEAIEDMTSHKPAQLTWFIRRFCEVRFLFDYADDERLLFRLNQVMLRVSLQPLPSQFRTILPRVRNLVASNFEPLFGGFRSPPLGLSRDRG